MATITSQYTLINKLYGMKEGSTNLSAAKAVYLGSELSKRVCKGNDIVYDVWDTELTANDIEMPKEGGNISNYLDVISKMTDIDKVERELEYSVNIETIPENTGNESKEHSIIITQELTNKSITIKCVQSGISEEIITWGTPKLNYISIIDLGEGTTISESGGSVTIQANITQTKTIKTSTTSTTEDVTQDVPVVKIYSLSSNIGTANGDTISVDTRYQTEGSARTVYSISGVDYQDFAGNIVYGDAALSVIQNANIKTPVGDASYKLTVSGISDGDTFGAGEEEIQIIVNSYFVQTYSWSSGAPNSTQDVPCNCEISTTRGSVYPSTVSGKNAITTLTLEGNTSSGSIDTTITFNNGIEKTITVSQSKDSSTVTYGNPVVTDTYVNTIDASGGYATLIVYYSQSKTTTFASGGSTTTTVNGEAEATIINGSAVSSLNWGTASLSDGSVYMRSMTDNQTSSKTKVYTIKEYSFTAYGSKSGGDDNASIGVYQEINELSNNGSPTYNFTLNSDATQTIEAGATTDTISFTSQTVQRTIYTSGTAGPSSRTNRACSIKISSGSSYASLSTTSSSSSVDITFEANTSSSDRTIKVTITDYEGGTHTVTYTQSANTTTTVLSNVTVDTISLDMSGTNASAGGEEITVSVRLKKTYTISSAASGVTYDYEYDYADSVTINGNGSASASGDTITVSSLRDNVSATTAQTVYTISSIKWSYKDENGKSWGDTYSYSKTIKQEVNSITYGAWTYSISASTSKKDYTAAATPVTASVTSKRTRSYTYTSGYTDSSGNVQTENVGWTASITTGNTVSPTSASAGTTTAQISLAANTSTTTIKSTTVTFKSSGDTTKTASITYTQSKDALASTSVNITPYNATATQALASGGTVTIAMSVKVTSTPVYISGNTGDVTTTYPAATVTSFIGSAQNSSGAYKNTAGTGVVVKSAGTTEHTSAWTVYEITSVTGTYDGKTYTWSGTLNIQQAPNTVGSWSYGDYVVTATLSSTSNISSSGGSFNVTVGCSRPKTRTWSSGSSETGTDYGEVTISGTNCTVSASSYTSTASAPTTSITATVGENISSARTCTVKVTSPTTSIYKNVSVTQNAVSYSFTASTTEYDSNATANTVNIAVTSSRNGKAWAISSSNVSLSPSGIGSVGSISASGSNYTIPISMNANTGASRTLTVTITQPGSGTTKTIKINQASGVVKEIAGVNIYESTYTNEAATSMSYDFTVTAKDTNKYSGGSVGTVKVGLNTMPDGSGANVATPVTKASSLSITAGTESSHYTGTFSVPSQYSYEAYLVIYFNNTVVAYSDIEEIIPE